MANPAHLTDLEFCYANFHARMLSLEDVPRTPKQTENTRAAAEWCDKRAATIKGQAQRDGGDWTRNHRRERYNRLRKAGRQKAKPLNLCQLPVAGSTPPENARISEREMWRNQQAYDTRTKGWKSGHKAWLIERRRAVYAIGEKNGWTETFKKRYYNLCVATEFGQRYDAWAKTHNTTTGRRKQPPAQSKRDKAVANARSHLGTSEHPAGSNRGSPQPSGWQKRVIGSDGFAWCACFTSCMAWDAGVPGTASAGVWVCYDLARRGAGIYRGWTTDPSRARKGDHAIIGSLTSHIGMVVDDRDAGHTIEGNTSPGSEGSQFNGGCVAERHRRPGEIVGYCLVRF
jgi:hypothetical protein